MKLSTVLIKWYLTNKRDLPWRNTKDPYVIWISEIILQQTRVLQGMDYFYRFIQAFPNVQALAAADQEQVLKLWQGLGYYSRARNLHHASRQIMEKWEGTFPSTHKDILVLKGIGDYTSAAIASFAFNQVFPVLDGNVFRFIARYFGVDTPINSNEAKKIFYGILHELIDKKDPAIFNQAIMEFGAMQCKPYSPDCSICPFSQSCFAFKNNAIASFPVKLKANAPKIRHFNYLLIEQDSSVYLKQRTENDIWKNLYDFPLIETTSPLDLKDLLIHSEWKNLFHKLKIKPKQSPILIEHKLTHRLIKAAFWKLKYNGKTDLPFIKVHIDEIHRYPVSRLLEKFLEKNFL